MLFTRMTRMDTDGCLQADGEVKSNICYWQKFNYGWHKLKTMCEVLRQCRVRHNGYKNMLIFRDLLCNLKNIFYLCSPNELIKVAHRWH